MRKGFCGYGVILGLVVVVLVWWSIVGCSQVIITKPDGTRYQVNTFLQQVDFDKLETANITIENYHEKPDPNAVRGLAEGFGDGLTSF